MTDAALLKQAEEAFEFIRLKLVSRLNEPERSAFWKAVEARDAIRHHTAAQASGDCGAWIAYADKLEAVLETVAGSSADELKRLQAKEGLQLVRPYSVPSAKCQCQPLTRYADAPHDEGCPLVATNGLGVA